MLRRETDVAQNMTVELYGRCEVCGEPRTVQTDVQDNVTHMSLVCSATETHPTLVPSDSDEVDILHMIDGG